MIDSELILTLSLSELTKHLKDGLLSPEDVFYSYMEKVQHNLIYRVQPNTGKKTKQDYNESYLSCSSSNHDTY